MEAFLADFANLINANTQLQMRTAPSGGGFGLFATRKIGVGETIVTIPEDVLITSSTALHSPISNIIRAGVDRGDDAISLFLMAIRSKAVASSFASYVAVLPAELDTLVCWSLAELELLDDRELADKAMRLREEQTKRFSNILARLEKANIGIPSLLPSKGFFKCRYFCLH